MIKSELILRVAAQNQHLYNRDVEKVVNTIFDEIEAALVRRERVELRGFGVFTLKPRSARPGRNPKTGALVSVPEKQHPSFRTGKEMRDRLNGIASSDCARHFISRLTRPSRMNPSGNCEGTDHPAGAAHITLSPHALRGAARSTHPFSGCHSAGGGVEPQLARARSHARALSPTSA